MSVRKFFRNLTFKEMEKILNSLESKFIQDRDEFEKFLPEIVQIFDNIREVKTKKQTTKSLSKKQAQKKNIQNRFTLIDEFLTEKDKKVRYTNAIKIIQDFKHGKNFTEAELKKCLVNAALVDFKKQAYSEDIQNLNQIVEQFLGISLLNETEKQFTFSKSTPIKKYELTNRVNIFLDRDFSLTKIEILKSSSK